MRRFFMQRLTLVLAITTLVSASNLAWTEEKDAGFVPLFNGKDLDGWEIKEPANPTEDLWTVKDGLLKAKAGSGWLGTKQEYANFVLKLQWRIHEGGNSGVFLRVPGVKPGVSPSMTGMEVQILDDNSDKYKGKLKPYQYSGSLYTFMAPSKQMFKGAGEWNFYEITCNGDKITVVYNGEKVVEADASKDEKLGMRPKKGFIGLQNHGSPVEFRAIRIKVLD
jgi:hypothetical protein